MNSKNRKRCTYPMSEFYNYEDEIPEGVRVSDPDSDCSCCTDEDCDERHCLIGPESEPDAATTLLYYAQRIVEDFDNYGEVLQNDDDGEYGPTSGIERLRAAIKSYKTSL